MPVATNYYWIESVRDVVLALLATIDNLYTSQSTLSLDEVDEILRQSFREMDEKKVRALTYKRDYQELRQNVLRLWEENR